MNQFPFHPKIITVCILEHSQSLFLTFTHTHTHTHDRVRLFKLAVGKGKSVGWGVDRKQMRNIK